MEIRIDAEGRLLLPAELLQELGWTPGTALEVERAEGGLRLRASGQGARSKGQGAGSSNTQPPASPYGAATPAGVDTATLKDEARRLADAMHNVARPYEALRRAEAEAETPAELLDTLFPTESQESTIGGPPVSRPSTATPTDATPPGADIVTYQGVTPRISASCFIAPGAFLAGDVKLGEECSVWPGASLRGDVNRIEIGARTNVQEGAVVHVDHDAPAVIGAGVTIGHQATVHGCQVEDDVLIGIHAVVLNGARLGKGCMIAAGAVVTPGTEIPPGKLALGIPAKVARDLTPEELVANRRNAAEYVRLRGEYLAVSVLGVRSSVFGEAAAKSEHRTPNTQHPTPNTPVYRCRRVRTPVEIDGALDEAAWMSAEPASAFQLSDGSGAPQFPTEARLCWDEAHLYIAFSCKDSDVWGTYTGRDEPLFDEEVVEIFLCPTGNLQHYFEFEVSPLNTVFDAKVFSPEGDRRLMLVDKEWDAPGLRTAVRVAGTVGRRNDHDLGWIAELAIPFQDLGLSGPPKPNEQWRVNLYRIERGEVEEFSAWSPTLKSPPDFHVPARFGTLVFVDE